MRKKDKEAFLRSITGTSTIAIASNQHTIHHKQQQHVTPCNTNVDNKHQYHQEEEEKEDE